MRARARTILACSCSERIRASAHPRSRAFRRAPGNPPVPPPPHRPHLRPVHRPPSTQQRALSFQNNSLEASTANNLDEATGPVNGPIIAFRPH